MKPQRRSAVYRNIFVLALGCLTFWLAFLLFRYTALITLILPLLAFAALLMRKDNGYTRAGFYFFLLGVAVFIGSYALALQIGGYSALLFLPSGLIACLIFSIVSAICYFIGLLIKPPIVKI